MQDIETLLNTHKPLMDEVARIAMERGEFTREKATALCRCFLRCFQVMALDMAPGRFSMPADVDGIWHAAIVNTRGYEALCRSVRAPHGMKGILHHSTVTSGETEKLKRGRRRALAREVKRLFPRSFNQAFWAGAFKRKRALPRKEASPNKKQALGNLIAITVRTLAGKDAQLVANLNWTIEQLKDVHSNTLGDAGSYRLVFTGRTLKDEDTLWESGLEAGDVVHLVRSLSGC